MWSHFRLLSDDNENLAEQNIYSVIGRGETLKYNSEIIYLSIFIFYDFKFPLRVSLEANILFSTPLHQFIFKTFMLHHFYWKSG